MKQDDVQVFTPAEAIIIQTAVKIILERFPPEGEGTAPIYRSILVGIALASKIIEKNKDAVQTHLRTLNKTKDEL